MEGIREANRQLEVGAAEMGIPMVKLFGFEKNEDEGVTVGGVTVPFASAVTNADLVDAGTPGAGKCRSDNKCAGPAHKTRYSASDGLHPNTLVQGLIANQIIKAFNESYGMSIDELSDDEILALAGSD